MGGGTEEGESEVVRIDLYFIAKLAALFCPRQCSILVCLYSDRSLPQEDLFQIIERDLQMSYGSHFSKPSYGPPQVKFQFGWQV